MLDEDRWRSSPISTGCTGARSAWSVVLIDSGEDEMGVFQRYGIVTRRGSDLWGRFAVKIVWKSDDDETCRDRFVVQGKTE